jgi:hypothetical protein
MRPRESSTHRASAEAAISLVFCEAVGGFPCRRGENFPQPAPAHRGAASSNQTAENPADITASIVLTSVSTMMGSRIGRPLLRIRDTTARA